MGPGLLTHQLTSGLIWAGTVANSGFEAKAVRLSTASMRGAVASRQRSRFSGVNAPSRACRRAQVAGLSLLASSETPGSPALQPQQPPRSTRRLRQQPRSEPEAALLATADSPTCLPASTAISVPGDLDLPVPSSAASRQHRHGCAPEGTRVLTQSRSQCNAQGQEAKTTTTPPPIPSQRSPTAQEPPWNAETRSQAGMASLAQPPPRRARLLLEAVIWAISCCQGWGHRTPSSPPGPLTLTLIGN